MFGIASQGCNFTNSIAIPVTANEGLIPWQVLLGQWFWVVAKLSDGHVDVIVTARLGPASP